MIYYKYKYSEVEDMNIIFTVAFADGFHGSVLHVYELASFFVKQGHSCVVATIDYTEEVRTMFRDAGVPLQHLNRVDFEKEYDVLFGVHFPLVSCLLKNKIKIKKLVLNCLSGSENIEVFPMYSDAAGLLLTCSWEVRDVMNRKFGIPAEKISVLENSIPNEYADYQRQHTPPTDYPRKIAVVSNHIPEEIFELKDVMPECDITYFGIQTGNYHKVTPELLDNFDVVISIGKTIQYAMGMGIPAYEYDRFGGNGYITPENMDGEAYYNFAGRNTRRKADPEQIKKELLHNYRNCLENQRRLREKALGRFLLSSSLDKLLQTIEASQDFYYNEMYNCKYNPDIDYNSAEMFNFYVCTYRNTISGQKNHIENLEEHCRNLESVIESMKSSTS